MKTILRVVVAAAVLAVLLEIGPRAEQGAGQGGQAGRGGQAAQGRGAGRAGGGQARDAAAQPVGTGTISGVVVNDAGTPVRRARVTLSGGELRGGRSTATNDEGAFEFGALPTGRFTLTASRAGFVTNQYGAKRAGRPGTPIQLAAGQKMERATVTLPRGSVVTGVVVDDSGEPSPGTQVRVMRFVMRSGERALEQAGSDTTDDRGMYRVYGLQPGDYMVSAAPRNQGTTGAIRETIAAELEALMQQLNAQGGGRGVGGGRGGDLMSALAGRGQPLAERAAQLQQQLAQTEQEQPTTYAPVYFPGTTSPSGAQTVTLGLGDERGGIDFRLMLVPTSRVSGSVVAATGTLPAGTQVALLSTDRAGLPNIPGVGSYNTRVGNDGRFVFQNVTPGQYTLQARASVREVDPNAPAAGEAGRGGRGGATAPGGGRGGQVTQVLWAAADVTVGNGDVPEMLLTLQPGMTIAGRVEFPIVPGATTDLSRVRLTLVARGPRTIEIGGTPPTQIDATGRFTITGVAPGRYSLTGAAGATGARGGTGAAGATGAAGTAPQAVTLESINVGGVEALDFPFEVGPNQNIGGVIVRFGTQTQELSGVLQDASGRPTPDYTVVVFPADTRYWTPQSRRIAASRPDTDGRFSMRNLPPGEYRLTAITDAEPGEWFDPAFLTQLQAVSIPVSIREGEKKVQDIRVAGGS